MKSRLVHVSFALLGIVAFVAIAIVLENTFAIPFDATYRVGCAVMCLYLIFRFGLDYPGERWPRVALLIATVVDVGLFFTPLVDRPSSRGEIVLFALPDAAIILAARTISYPVANDHQRAVRQQLIVAMILTVAFCLLLFALVLLPPRTH